jgi:hypothetical protein
MKQFIFSLILVVAFIMVVGCAGRIEHNYTRPDCEVIAIKQGTITVQDKGGNVWQFEGWGYHIGDKVDLKMHTNFTHNTSADDYIVDVK